MVKPVSVYHRNRYMGFGMIPYRSLGRRRTKQIVLAEISFAYHCCSDIDGMSAAGWGGSIK